MSRLATATGADPEPASIFRSPRFLIPTLAGLLTVVVAIAGVTWWMLRPVGVRLLGAPVSGGAWHSGAWLGSQLNADAAARFGQWRGRPLDVITTYPERHNFAAIASSKWHISTWDGFPGVVSYGLPLLSENGGEGGFDTVVAGTYDDVWRTVGKELVAAGRPKAYVRVGWEANGSAWFAWGATASTAEGYKAAFRHVVGVLREVAPDLVIGFDISCGTGLAGATSRLAALTDLYPGDDVVDVIGCDTYDLNRTRARTEAEWATSLSPADAPGIGDVLEFARHHRKGFAVPEWGLAKSSANGGGDNPFYITKMHEFFTTNADDLVLEAYFDEPDTSLESSFWSTPSQNPRAAEEYKRLWKN